MDFQTKVPLQKPQKVKRYYHITRSARNQNKALFKGSYELFLKSNLIRINKNARLYKSRP